MIHLISLALAFAGFLLLCAAMQRHQHDMIGAKLAPAAGRWLRWGGGALLLACWLIDAVGLGWPTGTVTAFGHLTLAAGLAIAILHWRGAQRATAVSRGADKLSQIRPPARFTAAKIP